VTDELEHRGAQTIPGYHRIIDRPTCDTIGVDTCTAWFNVGTLNDYMGAWDWFDNLMKSSTAEGYHKTRPGNPTASLGQFLVELRDLPKLPLIGSSVYQSLFKRGLSLPGIMMAAREIARSFRAANLGGEYLNVVFGWKPFVRDLQEIYNLWQNVDRQLAQIVKDNGKGVRRKVTLSDETSTPVSESRDFGYPGVDVRGFPGDLINAGGHTSWSKVTTRHERVWYAARYRYWIPDVSSSGWNRRAKLALFGALPTPELVWELVPFSWLIDWSVNVGDVLSNMSTNAVDNLVQDYSFVMREWTVTTTHTTDSNWSEWLPYTPGGHGHWTSTERQTVKGRTYGGSPYALNAVSGAPLTGYQTGVLAALGISLAGK